MYASTEHPLVTRARAFATEVLRPRAGEFDRDEAVPREIMRAMADEGFLGSVLPVEYGGAGLDPLSYGRLTLEIGKGCPSVRTLLTVHTSLVGETLARLGSPAQKDGWLPQLASGRAFACFALSEPLSGSDAAAASTSYRETDGGFVLNGRKQWISYGAVADLFLVFANCDGVGSAFLVERGMAGVSTTPMTGLMASRGSHIAQVDLDDVVVPRANLVGRIGAGFSFVANTALFFGRYSIAWAGVAIAEAALEEMAAYARTREQFGKKLRQHQLVMAMLADAVTGVHAGRALCERVGSMRNAGLDDAVNEANIAKYMTSQSAMAIATSAVQLLGANGISSAYPVERLFREAKVLEIIEGSTQIQQQLLSEFATSRHRLPRPTAPVAAAH